MNKRPRLRWLRRFPAYRRRVAAQRLFILVIRLRALWAEYEARGSRPEEFSRYAARALKIYRARLRLFLWRDYGNAWLYAKWYPGGSIHPRFLEIEKDYGRQEAADKLRGAEWGRSGI